MLGLYPIGSRAIAAGPFNLTAVTAQMTATLGLTFTVTVTAGLLAQVSATIPVSFSLTASLHAEQAITATLPISFNLTASVRDYGKPLRISAVPQSYTVRAMPAEFTAKALPQSFTLRGTR
jgi:hypothetical protein